MSKNNLLYNASKKSSEAVPVSEQYIEKDSSVLLSFSM